MSKNNRVYYYVTPVVASTLDFSREDIRDKKVHIMYGDPKEDFIITTSGNSVERVFHALGKRLLLREQLLADKRKKEEEKDVKIGGVSPLPKSPTTSTGGEMNNTKDIVRNESQETISPSSGQISPMTIPEFEVMLSKWLNRLVGVKRDEVDIPKEIERFVSMFLQPTSFSYEVDVVPHPSDPYKMLVTLKIPMLVSVFN